MIGWDVPKLWKGGECWIIGGGPSIPHEFGVPQRVIDQVQSGEAPISTFSSYFKPIHDRHVIGVNAAFLLGSWVDFVFFGDSGFYLRNREEMDVFPNLIATCDPKHRNKYGGGVKYMPKDRSHPWGITTKRGHVSWNLNSGLASFSLAYHLGVKRIYLLGFDMRLSADYKQHWHRHYKRDTMDLSTFSKKRMPFERHKKGFPQVAKDARKLKIEIINVSPHSTVEQFPRVRLKDVL